MRGEILIVDEDGHGLISGDDGVRYAFSATDLMRLGLPPRGASVDFVPHGERASQILILDSGPLAPASREAIPRNLPPRAPILSLWGYVARCLTTKYFDGTGRARRSEYWSFVLFEIIVFIVVMAVALIVIGLTDSGPGTDPSPGAYAVTAFAALAFLAVLIPRITVTIRRLHDVGLSGWLILLLLIPSIGGLFILVVSLIPSQHGWNKHGLRP